MNQIERYIRESRNPEDEILQEYAQKGANATTGYTEYDEETDNKFKELARAQIKALWAREEGKTDEEIEEMRS